MLILGPILSKKGIFSQKRKKSTSPLDSVYSNQSRYQISAYNDTFDIFWPNFSPKKVFPVINGKFAVSCASMVVTYCIKLFRTGADSRKGILMYFLLLVAETKNTKI